MAMKKFTLRNETTRNHVAVWVWENGTVVLAPAFGDSLYLSSDQVEELLARLSADK